MKNKIYLLSLLVLIYGFLLFNCKNSQDENYWFKKGVNYYSSGKNIKAMVAIDKALKIKPDFYQAWYYKGKIMVRFYKFKEAVESYDKALKIKPNYIEAWSSRGTSLYYLGKLKEAIESVENAIKFGKDHPNVEKYKKTLENFKKKIK
jgi:tetratricopeptide (TPR) repeat protein